MESDPTPVLALIGCGAIADAFHLPALARLDGVVERMILVDRDLPRARALAARYGAAAACADAGEALARAAGAIVAVPRHLHFPVVQQCLAAGVHVLCEKPLCQSPEEGRTLVEEAQRRGVTLAVNQNQRAAWSNAKVRELIAGGEIGEPLRIDLVLGEPFDWPAASNSYFGSSGSTRGALLDQGVHLVDLLCWWLGGRPELVDYRDDSFGGTEAVAALELKRDRCRATIRLSWLSKLANTWRVEGERGRLEGGIYDWSMLTHTNASGAQRKLRSDVGRVQFEDMANAVIENFVGVVRGAAQPLVSGADALPALEIIDACYQRRARFEMPWQDPPQRVPARRAPRPSEGVLVTGAGGFVGGRVAEVLHQLDGYQPRCGVRRWSSAARIGRFPMEIVQCDVTDADQVARALDGVSAVVHCAVGDRRVTVDGTRNLLDGARKAGVARFVHISTVAVYGAAQGDVGEDRAPAPSGDEYGRTKLEAERVCLEFSEKGLPVCILRPTLVYGPFSESWTLEWARRLQARPWLLAAEDCQGTCNLLYVDDLVSAILAALERDGASGETLNVNGPDRPTWHAYFEALNDALGLPPLVASTPRSSHLKSALMQPVRAAAKFGLAHFEDQIMGLYQRSELAKRVMKVGEGMIRKTPTAGEFALLGNAVSYPTARAERVLDWQPSYAMADGVRLSAQWLRHHGVAPDGPGR